LIAGIPRETTPGEKRVSLVPENISKLGGLQITMERGAGDAAGYPDSAYVEKGARIADDARSLYGGADLVLKVMPPTPSEAGLLKEGSTLISFLYPMANIETVQKLTARRTTVFAMELMPRISRAQSMDALSSQATLAGYKAVLIAADSLPRLFPLMMTAAGTIPAAKVFVVGAGVAGLQAIAAARRLGAIVEAYDVRPAVKEQVASLGARFVELPVETKEAQDAGGYAKAQSEEFYMKQQKLLAERAEYFVFNGAVGALTSEHPLKAKVGETVRIFFGVGGPNATSSFHVIGEIFDRVYSQAAVGSPAATNVQTTTVAPGGATIVEFKLEVPGRYILVDHALSRLERGLAGFLIVDGDDNPAIFHGNGPASTSGH